jgi:hypothetical protein
MFLAGDDHYDLLEGAGLVGVGFGDLPSLRKELLSLFDQANAQAAATLEATPEVTVQPGSETTPEATPTLSG